LRKNASPCHTSPHELLLQMPSSLQLVWTGLSAATTQADTEGKPGSAFVETFANSPFGQYAEKGAIALEYACTSPDMDGKRYACWLRGPVNTVCALIADPCTSLNTEHLQGIKMYQSQCEAGNQVVLQCYQCLWVECTINDGTDCGRH